MPYPEKLSKYTQAACEACYAVGSVLKNGFGEKFAIYPKGNNNDLVTSYDHLAEKVAVDFLQAKFPEDSFICEERGMYRYREDRTCWMIDPLDGTVNFAHNIPFFCVTIAAISNGNVISGATYIPMLDELFYAEKNTGAFFNGRPIKVSAKDDLYTSYLATSLSFNLHQNKGHTIELFSHMAKLGFPLRSFGSTAISLAYIACGRFDGYWSLGGGLRAWDIAAGKLLIEEAGGKMTLSSGKPLNIQSDREFVASNGNIHGELIRQISEGNK